MAAVRRCALLALLLPFLILTAPLMASLPSAAAMLNIGVPLGAPPDSLAACSGSVAPYAHIAYGQSGQVKSAINTSCAPASSNVTSVDVEIQVRHACSRDLNIRLDKLPHSTFLQERDCSVHGGEQILSFSSDAFNAIDPNGAGPTRGHHLDECMVFTFAHLVRHAPCGFDPAAPACPR